MTCGAAGSGCMRACCSGQTAAATGSSAAARAARVEDDGIAAVGGQAHYSSIFVARATARVDPQQD